MKVFQMMFMAGALVVGGSALTTPAAARGFFGGIVEDVCGQCGVGRTLDQWNGAAGRPFENFVVRPAMNGFVPGSGDLFIAGQRLQDQFQNMPIPQPGYGVPMPVPGTVFLPFSSPFYR